jgi:uncharacterized protein YbaA (DUF1428 family)
MYAVCFVLPVARKNIGAYKKIARRGAKVWKKYGALQCRETVGDDLQTPFGGIPFAKLAKCKPHETVVVSWVLYKSKAHRKQVSAKVNKDPFMANFDPKKLPFDPKRMTYGGFKVIAAA